MVAKLQDNNQTQPKIHETERPHRSIIGTVWITLIFFVIVLIALLIFIAQNSMVVKIHYLGAKGSISFGVAMLLSAAAGIVLTLLIGSLRIIQLKFANHSREESLKDNG